VLKPGRDVAVRSKERMKKDKEKIARGVLIVQSFDGVDAYGAEEVKRVWAKGGTRKNEKYKFQCCNQTLLIRRQKR